MTWAIVAVLTEQDRAYARYRVRVEAGRRRVEALRAELDGLRAATAGFEAEYVRRVGGLVAELDRVGLRIAEQELRLARVEAGEDPDPEEDPEFGSDLGPDEDEVFTAGADGTSAGRRGGPADGTLPGPFRPRVDPATEAEARRLYRALAKRYHPDLAGSADDLGRREAVMLRVNAAFRLRDVAALRALWRDAEGDDPAFHRRPAAAKLAWAIREATRLEASAAALGGEVTRVRAGRIYRLWLRHEAGEEVLETVEEELEGRLARDGKRLDDLVLAVQRAVSGRARATEPAAVA